MKVICKGRGEGKTTDLIKLSAETGVPILRAGNIWYVTDLAEEMGLSIPKPMSIREAKETRPDRVYIDDVDHVLRWLLGTDVEACTLTPTDD